MWAIKLSIVQFEGRFSRRIILTYKQKSCNNYCFLRTPCTIMLNSAGVAQSAEQLICNQQVAGSSPITSSWRGSRAAKGGRL